MRYRDPKALWDELRRTVRHWMRDEEDDEKSEVGDPSLIFHLTFTVPLLITLLIMVARHA